MAGEVFRRPWDYRRPVERFFALLAAAGAAVGTAAVTITPTATLTGEGQLAGTCTISCSTSAEITGGLFGAANSAMLMSAQGVLTGTGNLAGATALTFGENANLAGQGYVLAMWRPPKRPASPPEMSMRFYDRVVIFNYTVPSGILGQGDMAFGGSATLVASGQLVGVADGTFGGTGTLRGTAALAGSSAIAFTPVGDLTSGASGAVTGTLPFTLTPTGTLTGTGNMSGSAAMSFENSMQPGFIAPIVGSAALTFGNIARLTQSDTQPLRIRITALVAKIRIDPL